MPTNKENELFVPPFCAIICKYFDLCVNIVNLLFWYQLSIAISISNDSHENDTQSVSVTMRHFCIPYDIKWFYRIRLEILCLIGQSKVCAINGIVNRTVYVLLHDVNCDDVLHKINKIQIYILQYDRLSSKRAKQFLIVVCNYVSHGLCWWHGTSQSRNMLVFHFTADTNTN